MALVEQISYRSNALSFSGDRAHLHRFEKKQFLVIERGAVELLTHSLAEKVRASGFKPNVIVDVIRGGMEPGRELADYLGNLPVLPLTIISDYQPSDARLPPKIIQELPNKEKVEKELREYHRLEPNQTIGKVLVVEEVVDNGETIKLVNQHLQTKWELTQENGQVKIAALAAKDKGLASTQVDYYTLKTNDWIIFPWEARETFTSLREMWKGYETPLSDAEIRDRFRELGYSERDINDFSGKS